MGNTVEKMGPFATGVTHCPRHRHLELFQLLVKLFPNLWVPNPWWQTYPFTGVSYPAHQIFTYRFITVVKLWL